MRSKKTLKFLMIVTTLVITQGCATSGPRSPASSSGGNDKFICTTTVLDIADLSHVISSSNHEIDLSGGGAVLAGTIDGKRFSASLNTQDPSNRLLTITENINGLDVQSVTGAALASGVGIGGMYDSCSSAFCTQDDAAHAKTLSSVSCKTK